MRTETKRKLISSGIFCVIIVLVASTAHAYHRAGWFPLPSDIAVGDFNEDGNVDIAVVNTGFDNVAIMLGDGKGGFTLAGEIHADTLPRDIKTADLNGDGHLDLVVASSWGFDLQVYLGDGRGGFSPGRQIYAEIPWGIALADFDEDGHPDLAVGLNGASTVSVYKGDGVGDFATPPTNYAQPGRPVYMTTGDLNHDKHLDLAVVDEANSVSVMLGNGRGGFTTQSPLNTNNLPTQAMAADFNNDGNLDLLVDGGQPSTLDGIYLDPFLGNGTGVFTALTPIPGGDGYAEGTMASGDFNEDGNLDVAVGVNTAPSQGNNQVTNQIWVYFGDGRGNFSAPTPITVGYEPYSVAAVDINRDGHLDLLVSNRTDGTVTTLIGDGRGNFTTYGNYSTEIP